MTLQARGFQWSAAIHGMIILVVALVQFFSVPPNKITLIDFTLTGNSSPAAMEQPPPPQAPPVKQEPKRARAILPKKAVAKPAPLPQKVEAVQAPPEVPATREEPPAPLSPAAEGLGRPAAEGTAGPIPPLVTAGTRGARQTQEARPQAPETDGSARGKTASAAAAPATPTPEASRAAYLKEHFVYIRDRITGSISYPPMARKMGWCGQVKIAFVVCEDGGVMDVKVIESSGFTMLDRNAVDTVKNVAPFPHPPVQAEIRMAITYRFN